MITVVDREPIGVETLRETIDELEPSTDRSIPAITGIRSLAADANRGGLPDETVEKTIADIPRLLEHDRSSVHRLAAVAGTVLVDVEPDAADPLLDRLVAMLDETVTERRAMEAIEYLSTTAPGDVGERLHLAVDRLDHSRDGIARHAAGTLLGVSTGSPDDVIETVPRLLASLTDSFEPTTAVSESTHGGNLQSLEHGRRLEYASSRLIVARAIAAVAESQPEATADVVVESGTVDVLESLFDDQQPRVRAAAVGLASYVAEREPESIEPAIPGLVERLDDDHEVVRASAIWALGALDHPRASEGLRAAREDEPSDELRDLVEATLRSSGPTTNQN